MRLDPSAIRAWRSLVPEERRLAADAFLREPPPELLASALAAIVRARHMRPQAVRAMAPEERAAALAAVRDPGEPLAGSLLVALHLAERRPLLGAFLDRLGLPHDDGVMADETGGPLEATRVEEAARELVSRFPSEQVRTYFSVLLLQDPERWAPLRVVESWP